MTKLNPVLKEIKDFHQENNVCLVEIKEEISKMIASMDEVEARFEKMEERSQNMEDAMMEIIKLQIRLEDKCIDLERWSRRGNVRIYDVPEAAEWDVINDINN